MLNGKVEPCATVLQAIHFSNATDTKDEYVDLFDGKTKEEQIKKFIDIFNKDVLKSCMYCNGLCGDAGRFVPAEQL